MGVEVDDRGRLYLPKEIRDRHGERFRVLDLPDRVVLIPVDDNPLQAVRDAVGHRFEDVSIEEVRAEIVASAKAEIDAERREGESE